MTTETATYLKELRRSFARYRDTAFAGKANWFKPSPLDGPIVFKPVFAENNLLIPSCTPGEWKDIVQGIPKAERHKHFGSMQSSQALAQSVFGVIVALNRLPLLTSVKCDDSASAFGHLSTETRVYLEKKVRTLGESPSRTTSIDVWFEGNHRVAVECKLAESVFGSCSRPRLRPTDKDFEAQHCDGTYTRQRKRIERCALTEIRVRYWEYVDELFEWSSKIDHRPCPLNKTYQLVRNILAACVDGQGSLQTERGHALLIYDLRNPSMADAGNCGKAWLEVTRSLRVKTLLRRISWQRLIAQWPDDPVLNWLKQQLAEKFGLIPL